LSTVTFLNHPWHQLKFLSISPLAQLVAPEERSELAALLTRAGVFLPWPSGLRNPDRLPQVQAYLRMPGRGPASRFCNGTFRALYAGKTLEVCRAEMIFHHGRALRDSGEPPGAARIFEALDLRVGGTFTDVRKGHAELHRPGDYAPSQAFGAALKSAGSPGILFRSVRRKGEVCLVILEAASLRTCIMKDLVALRWDGETLG
jgi:hypothetical protein